MTTIHKSLNVYRVLRYVQWENIFSMLFKSEGTFQLSKSFYFYSLKGDVPVSSCCLLRFWIHIAHCRLFKIIAHTMAVGLWGNGKWLKKIVRRTNDCYAEVIEIISLNNKNWPEWAACRLQNVNQVSRFAQSALPLSVLAFGIRGSYSVARNWKHQKPLCFMGYVCSFSD